MILKSGVVVLLTLAKCVLSMPRRPSKCIEDANPIFDSCFKNTKGDTESVSLEQRHASIFFKSRTVQFADTFTRANKVVSAGNSTVVPPNYPQGLALSYPGFAFSSIESNELLMPSPPQVLVTDPSLQNTVGRQPGMIRQSNTSSFDLRNFRFACAYYDAAGQITLPSCLITLTCQPMIIGDREIPNGHRPTSRPTISSTFEFTPNRDHSSLTWSDPAVRDITLEDSTNPATLYGNADLGDDFYDLDHCYVVLEQFSAMSANMNAAPVVLIDDVVGVAYYDQQET